MLEAAGWRVGTVRAFLGLSAAEAELVAMLVALGAGPKHAVNGRG